MKKVVAVLIVVVIIIVAFVVSRSEKKTGVFRIGAIESLTGNAAFYGQSARKGVDLGLEVARQKYPGVTFELYHEDNQFNSKVGVDAYKKLRVEKSIDAVITQNSPVAVAIRPLADQDGILQMAVSSSASSYSSPGDLSFRTTSSSAFETDVIAGLMKKKYTTTALLGMNNEIGVSSIKGIEKQLASSSVHVLSTEMFPVDTVDFRTNILKLKQEKVSNVYFAGLASHVAMFLKQAEELGVSLDVLTFRTGEDPVLIQNAGKLAERVVFTSSFDSENNDAGAKEFISLYTKKYNEEPNSYAAEGYTGTIFVADALAKCGTEKTCIFSYLSTIKDYPTPFGKASFDASGDIYYPFFLKTVRDGKFVRYNE